MIQIFNSLNWQNIPHFNPQASGINKNRVSPTVTVPKTGQIILLSVLTDMLITLFKCLFGSVPNLNCVETYYERRYEVCNGGRNYGRRRVLLCCSLFVGNRTTWWEIAIRIKPPPALWVIISAVHQVFTRISWLQRALFRYFLQTFPPNLFDNCACCGVHLTDMSTK